VITIVVQNAPVSSYHSIMCTSKGLAAALRALTYDHPVIVYCNENTCTQVSESLTGYGITRDCEPDLYCKYQMILYHRGIAVLTRQITWVDIPKCFAIRDITDTYSLEYYTNESRECAAIVTACDLLIDNVVPGLQFDPKIYADISAVASMFEHVASCADCNYVTSLSYKYKDNFVGLIWDSSCTYATVDIINRQGVLCFEDETSAYWNIPEDIAYAYADIGLAEYLLNVRTNITTSGALVQ
jgi:hypothetical protein